MTIIVALAESENSILIAADSCEPESPGDLASVYLKKLKLHHRGVIAWAAAGNGGVSEAFSVWLAAIDPLPDTWEVLVDQAAEHLARLNGRQRELKELAKTPIEGNDTTAVIITGSLGTIQIVELDDRGNATPYFERGICAIGTAKPHVLIAHRTLEVVEGMSPLDKLTWIMKVAMAMAHDCGPPLHIWRITSEGVTNALNGESIEACVQ